jgi:dolichyl-phosphate-mannose-protein mannosyltransferase
VAPTNAAKGGPAPPVAEDPQKEVNLTPLGSGDVPAQPLISASTETIPSAVQGKLDRFLQDIQDQVQPAADNHNAGAGADEADGSAQESFSTRYQTHTRIVDEQGREIYDGPVFVEVSDEGHLPQETAAAGVAGTIASAPEPETAADPAAAPSGVPAEVEVPKEEKTGKKEATGKFSVEPEEKVLKAEETGRDEL